LVVRLIRGDAPINENGELIRDGVEGSRTGMNIGDRDGGHPLHRMAAQAEMETPVQLAYLRDDCCHFVHGVIAQVVRGA